jgi:hypothetical protein
MKNEKMKKMKKCKEQQSPLEISYDFLTLRLDSNSIEKSGIRKCHVATALRDSWR